MHVYTSNKDTPESALNFGLTEDLYTICILVKVYTYSSFIRGAIKVITMYVYMHVVTCCYNVHVHVSGNHKIEDVLSS